MDRNRTETPAAPSDVVTSATPTSPPGNLGQITALMRLLSDQTRLSILMLLSAGERNVTSLCDTLKLPQPTVSHHLGLLRMHDVVRCRRNGKQVIYALNPDFHSMGGGNLALEPTGLILRIQASAQ